MTSPAARPPTLAALFLVSAASVGFEIALTRYFAVAKWSEYGYWVISIVLAGFALSGVTLALARTTLTRNGPALLAWLPAALIASGALGYQLVTENPFNPLVLQNPTTLWPELWLIGLYYVELIPFFFLAGLFVSLNFVLGGRRLGRVYGFDLTGAGAGALLVLGLMWLVHPFQLVPCLLPTLVGAAVLAPRARLAATGAALLVLFGAETLLARHGHAAFNDFKAIYAPLHTPDSRVVAERPSPRGLAMLLDDFTERVDTDVSNDAAGLGFPGPPRAYGVYRDGNRVAALPRTAPVDVAYAGATLAALPYTLLHAPRVLLAGASGGFRIAEALALGAAQIDAAEPDPLLRDAIRDGLGPAPPRAADSRVRLRADSVLWLAARGHYDLVDLSADFLDAAPANAHAFAAEALAADLRAVAPGGLVSVPVSIREFPAYALRVLATLRSAFQRAGIAGIERNVLVYRSAWNVRILASPAPLAAAAVAAARAWCDARSFDVSYYPGIDVAAARAGIYNDLPAVSFDTASVTSEAGSAHDAIADEVAAVLAGGPTPSARTFDLRPVTLDRPAFYAMLRLADIGTILRRLELLPQAEVGPIVSLAVLAQAVVVALVVVAVPWLGGASLGGASVGGASVGGASVGGARAGRVAGGAVYFACLGLGFLFIEIVAIERASLYLDDRTSGFALVLTGMLAFSGLGALLADRFAAVARRAMTLAVAGVLAWGTLALTVLQPLLLASLGWPWPVRAALVLAAVAPVSVALGMPFPLGLARVEGLAPGFLPWAWGLNGAFSVVSTPLANLLAQQFGLDRVLLLALMLYGLAAASFPARGALPSRTSPCPRSPCPTSPRPTSPRPASPCPTSPCPTSPRPGLPAS